MGRRNTSAYNEKGIIFPAGFSGGSGKLPQARQFAAGNLPLVIAAGKLLQVWQFTAGNLPPVIADAPQCLICSGLLIAGTVKNL
ncbi:MAG: hypothetical protein Pg6A_03170 [Termitinemataceae bacterium]|nr:MAG: hypothetical protein Pg6A_03170 [Termitinemataceae bacterium]